MSGWFPESDYERHKRIQQEDRTSRENAEARRKKVELRKKNKAEFQKKIDAEVEKRFEELSPDAKRERLEKLHGSSSLLNGALGLEHAAKGQKTATPWMNPGYQAKSLTGSVKNDGEQDTKATAAAAPPERVIRLTRPY